MIKRSHVQVSPTLLLSSDVSSEQPVACMCLCVTKQYAVVLVKGNDALKLGRQLWSGVALSMHDGLCCIICSMRGR